MKLYFLDSNVLIGSISGVVKGKPTKNELQAVQFMHPESKMNWRVPDFIAAEFETVFRRVVTRNLPHPDRELWDESVRALLDRCQEEQVLMSGDDEIFQSAYTLFVADNNYKKISLIDAWLLSLTQYYAGVLVTFDQHLLNVAAQLHLETHKSA